MRTRPRLFRVGVAATAGLCLIAFAGCPRTESAWPDKPGPKVLASFAPVYCFAANVVGDAGTVKPVMTSQGPHHFDPKPADSKLVQGADLFVINGLGLDNRKAAKMMKAAGNNRLKLCDLGVRLDAKSLMEGACHHDHEHGDGHDHDHDHDAPDPHVWLGLDLAAHMVGTLRDDVKALDPAHAADYDRRAAEYTVKLEAIKAEGEAKLKGKTERKFVTFHESLGYFARTFGLEVAAVVQSTPGKEPSAKELDALIQTCVKQKVRVIAVEPQYSTRSSAQRLRDELARKGIADAALVELDPLETATEADLTADWYERKMRANVDALAGALK